MSWQSQCGVAFLSFYPNKCVVSFFKGFVAFFLYLGFVRIGVDSPLLWKLFLLLKSIKTLIE